MEASTALVSTVEKVLFLKSIDLFRQIPGEDLVRVAQIAEEVSFEPGADLMVEGDPGDSMYLLIAGRVHVIIGGEHIATLGERECVGEMTILDSEPRSATVRCVEAVAALKIEREDFYDLMNEVGDIALGMIKVLTRRLRELTRARSESMSDPAVRVTRE